MLLPVCVGLVCDEITESGGSRLKVVVAPERNPSPGGSRAPQSSGGRGSV